MSDEARYTFAEPDRYCCYMPDSKPSARSMEILQQAADWYTTASVVPAQLMAEMAEMRRRVTVDWPKHNDQPAQVVHVAGYTGPPQ